MDTTGTLDEARQRLHACGPERLGRELADRPWREVLARWWPRLLPGLYGGSTHPVIRVGHAVRTLPAGPETGPRLAELAHGPGYWAARHRPLAVRPAAPVAGGAAAALDAVVPVAGRTGGFPERLERVTALPDWTSAVTDPAEAHRRLTGLVRTATHRYATHGHGEGTMLVHAATAPNAVLRTLPALPRELWAPSLHAAWAASAASPRCTRPTPRPTASRRSGARPRRSSNGRWPTATSTSSNRPTPPSTSATDRPSPPRCTRSS